jgi:glycosyltransferase involved in cell wall biosynthesis
MRVLHVDTSGDACGVDGLARWVLNVALAQGRDGHDVTIAMRSEPHAEPRSLADADGVRLLHAHRSRLRPSSALLADLRRTRPDVVHLHGAWVPAHAALGLWLRRRRIPYVYSTHGCFSVDTREAPGLVRKLYVGVVERLLTRGAAGFVIVNEGEADDLAAVLGRPADNVIETRIPVDTEALLARPQWAPPGPDAPVVTLARYSVFQKGLDLLAEVARLRPEVEFHLHGSEDPAFPEGLAALRRSAPPNLRFKDPVYGDEKVQVLSTAAAYLQTSRFEGWSLSVVEALAIGLPCVVMAGVGGAKTVEAEGAGVAVEADAAVVAAELRALLGDDARRRSLSEGGRRLAAGFGPAAAAEDILRVYERCLR